MPLSRPDDFGTNADGSRSGNYCRYCFKNGAFTAECSMEELRAFCSEIAAAPDSLSPADAKNRLRRLFYSLKPESGDKTIEEKATELLEWCNTITLASVNAEGCPRPVVLAKIAAQGYNEVDGNGYRWRSRNHLRRRNAPTLVAGVARRILSGGPADPNYTLFRFIGRTATL